jgi:hypothetical protein
MAWKYWNKKQKKVFLILITVLIIIFILAIPSLKGTKARPIAKIVGILLTFGIIWIVDNFQDDYEENVSEGSCIKCNKCCQTTYFEKNNQIEYDCPTCGKYKM